MSEAAAIVEVKDKVGYITLNRPDKLNALNAEMIAGMKAALTDWAMDPEIGCVVLTGEGRAFCAGGDVSAMAADKSGKPMTMEQKVDGLRHGQEVCWLLHSMPKITIAAVNGFAMGAGLGIAMSCDLRIASDKAKFGTAYAKVGLGGDWGATWQITQIVGEAKAKELMILADIIEADEALRIGLVNRVVDHDLLQTAVEEMAHGIAHGPLVSYRDMKENINLAVRSDFRTTLDREAFTQIRGGEPEEPKKDSRALLGTWRTEYQGI